MTDENDRPTYYAWGEEVRVRGVEFGPETTRNGEEYTQFYLHVQFPERTETTKVHPGVISVNGGLGAMWDDLRERGLVPEWLHKNSTPPWEETAELESAPYF